MSHIIIPTIHTELIAVMKVEIDIIASITVNLISLAVTLAN